MHAFTGNPEHVTCGADILVSDIGVPNMIRGHWLKPGVVVVDMGANSVEVATSCYICTYKLVFLLLAKMI